MDPLWHGVVAVGHAQVKPIRALGKAERGPTLGYARYFAFGQRLAGLRERGLAARVDPVAQLIARQILVLARPHVDVLGTHSRYGKQHRNAGKNGTE